MQGILVGCNKDQEWLLPWFWSHFYKKNKHYSIAFADFGMSQEAKAWCRERGELIEISEPCLYPIEKIDQSVLAFWKNKYDTEFHALFNMRKTWFKKPLAMASTPFTKTLWLDLDCEVKESLTPLFSLPLFHTGFGACAYEKNFYAIEQFPEALHYNSGVIVYEKNSPLLALWNREIFQGSQWAFTEEDLLSFLIAFFQIPLTPLSPIYNWEILRLQENPNALIYHWAGKKGKEMILIQLRD